ncbi:CPBP family intramembrane metalloprotease [Geodermatophilus sp. YIM 151500]|uniref:CPBP family intramembrane glutamic endopeptidase n=1 Tax=Geodermatophilus sp. YIM 151500 TaxID=2984531 RepID=UPI0021E49DFE|nr:CPBP family intramembrane glutamic endopeptidase [Geodermatophilus sp. YIM 151500]MCV2487761.1 CPBP family intramembrane metalloprotease [Geodermatophilus sp. YIM 151500]
MFTGSLVVVLAAWNNAVVVRLPGYPGSYAAANLAATAALLAAARAGGLSWTALGLSPGRLAAGARLGGACAAVVAAGYGLALAVPALRPLLADARVAGLSGGQVAHQVLVRIPLGTVLWEEVAFRGVLLAALVRVVRPRTAVLGSAALFGAWHVRPALSAVAANDLAESPVARAALVLAGCAVTATAGVLFTWLRLRSGSLLAPVLLHLATNCLGVPAAVLAARTA